LIIHEFDSNIQVDSNSDEKGTFLSAVRDAEEAVIRELSKFLRCNV